MAGWGTWGHVFPIRSLLEFLNKSPDYEQKIDKIYWLWSKNSLEEQVATEMKKVTQNLEFIRIISGKYRRETYRKSRLKNISDIFLFLIWCFQSLYQLLLHRVDVVFCKWGYVALPVVIAAWILRRKIVVHESDTHPGLVNRIASRCSKKVFTWFDWALPGGETIGQIISDDIVTDVTPQNTPTTQILIVGWSQGSQRLYQHLINIFQYTPDLSSWYEFHIVLWLANQEMSTQFDRFSYVHTYGFISQKEMGELYNNCDIAITRWGTTSLAEQKLYDMRQIIVPIPRTHDQEDNAKRYVRYHNDIMLSQRDADFEFQLTNAIKHFKGYKKIWQPKDKLAIIAQAKKTIWEAIVG